MAAPGEGAAEQSASAYEGGGIGGKFRKRPFRKAQTTPYERPPTALRNRSWLSKLVVDPATRLLTTGAQRFFAPVFRKRLLSPPQPREEKQEPRERLQERVPDNSAGPQQPADNVADGSICNNDNCGISELEQLLKQKTFTRSEVEHLSELLRSRAVDISVKDDGVSPGANISIQNKSSKAILDTRTHQNFVNTLEENKTANGRTKTKKLQEDEIASPMELAKSYMGARPSQASPLTLSLHGQNTRDDTALSLFASKQPMSLKATTSTAVRTPENGFATPRSRGRSAIYNMARTPYSRLNPSPMHKVSNSYYGYSRALPSSSKSVRDNGEQKGYEPMALKRRSSVLDSDIESAGPIRRIRQKPNLLSHGISLPSREMKLISDATHLHKLPQMDETKNRASNTASTSYAHVPPESGEMAARIFEHLEKMTPKEKSLTESKLMVGKEKASFKLTPNMLHGQALKSLEDLDASKLFPSSQNDHKMWDKPISSSRDSITQKKNLVKENGPAKSVHSLDKLDSAVNTDTTSPMKDNELTNEDASIPNIVPKPSQRSPGFKMSAHEDFFELDEDEDEPSNKPATGSAEVRVPEKSMLESSMPGESQTFDKSAVSCEVTKQPVHGLSWRTELDTGTAFTNGGEHYTTTLSLTQVSSSSQSALPSQSALAHEGPTTVSDSALFLGFGSKAMGNAPSTPEPKAESSSSLLKISPVVTDVKVLESDRNNTTSSQLLDGTAAPSVSSSSASAISIFSSAAPFSHLGSGNGTVASSASMLSSPCDPAPIKLGHQNFMSHPSELVPSTVMTAISNNGSTTNMSAVASDGGFFATNFAPAVTPAPILSFGSSKDPSNAPSAPSTIANAGTATSKVNAEKENGLHKSSNSSLGSTSFAGGSTSSRIFGLGSFVSSSAANSKLQVSDTASGSGASTVASSAGSGIATLSQTAPVQFGSSSPSMFFGASGITSFTSSNIFGSSAPATFAQSSASCTSETNLLNSSSGDTPNTFKLGVVASSASSEVNASTTGATATPDTFVFGVSSAASSTSNSSLNPVFFSAGSSSLASLSATSSSSTPGMFNFNASSSVSSTAISGSSTSGTLGFGASSLVCSSATSGSTTSGMFGFGTSSSVSSLATSGSNTSGIFNYGGSSSASSTPTNAVISSSGTTSPGVFGFGISKGASSSEANFVGSSGANSSPFGSGWQAPVTPIFGSSSPSTGFSLGASSSSFGIATASPFGTTTGASPSPFSFSAASSMTSSFPSSSSQAVFGNTAASPFAGNNDQMNTEDSMVEDPVQSSSTPAVPLFGQAAVSPSPSGIMFGSTAPSPFQFGGQQQNQPAPQNPLQFQPSGSLEFSAGGSFSLGSNGGDKSGRRIIRASRNRAKKR